MLHVFSGNDSEAIGRSIGRIIEGGMRAQGMRRHFGDVTIAMLDPYFSESLFGETYTVALDGISMFPEETRAFVLSRLSFMKDAEHVFVVVDEKPSKEFKDALKPLGVAIVDLTKREKEESTPFAFTDAVLGKDKKNAWMSLVGLYRDGRAPEEVHGALFWAVKSLALVASGKFGSQDDLGMKPFVYQKNKRFAALWTGSEVEATMKELVSMLERSRRRAGDLGAALERFSLSLPASKR